MPGTGTKLSRREREKLRHRNEILGAAERVFIRKGYHHSTVEEIAQEAEFSVGSIYNFFQGKEELYAEVVHKIARDFMDLFEKQVLGEDDPEQAISALIELRLTYFEDHRGFFRVFFETSPSGRFDPARVLPENCINLYDQYIDIVSGIFRRGVEDRRFDNLDPLYLTLCLEGIINAFVAYWSRIETAEPLAERVAKMKDAFLGRIGHAGTATGPREVS